MIYHSSMNWCVRYSFRCWFSGLEESIMTYNPYGLKIEINMSNGTKYVDNIMSHRPNRENLIGCHNFIRIVIQGYHTIISLNARNNLKITV